MRKIDQKITQDADDVSALLWRLQLTLNVAHTEAKLAFQRTLENYELLAARIQQIRDAMPQEVQAREVTADPPRLRRTTRRRSKSGQPALK